MISASRFLDAINKCLGRDLRDVYSTAQLEAVLHGSDQVLNIVAGPGSGKTAVLVLRALRFVLVDDLLPEDILIVTFTRKAARELRTRWLDWGTALCMELQNHIDLDRIDLNRCRIDTLDSVAQQILTEYRLPGTLAPVVAETSASNLILKRFAFGAMYKSHRGILDPFFSRYTFDGCPPLNRGDALRVAKRLIERLIQDRVDLRTYSQGSQAQSLMVEMLTTYRQQAIKTNVFDFTILEEEFLKRLSNNSLDEWLGHLRAVLIDEYQDTNPLQEAIYLRIIALPNVSATIVGDDDQSMYRFRGGSVELFTDFETRCLHSTAQQTKRIDMTRNFRSRPEIVEFYNNHITGDSSFAGARIQPAKPLVVPTRSSEGIPVLGMFREDPASLSISLSSFFARLVNDRRFVLDNDGREITMHTDGHLGDAVLIAHSIEESKYNRRKGTMEERFPGMLRHEMQANGLKIFNPRGQALRNIPDVRVLLGLILLATDPDSSLVNDVYPTNEARLFLQQWRQEAQQFVLLNPLPNQDRGLEGFIQDWQGVASGGVSKAFPRDWPLLELVFKLITWIPGFQDDPEHQVWLEAITRTIASVGMASPYSMHLLQNTSRTDQGSHILLSRASIVRDALLPIAEDEVVVDEDIMPSVPRDCLQLMTIHQAKGLEFPLVVVDVGSHFMINHDKQRFFRFPKRVSNVVQAEDDVEPYLQAPLRRTRSGMDRTFDDLVRLYYVAYSRPQSVLLLVGCENCLRYGSGRDLSKQVIPHVALGWRRDNTWSWRQPYGGRRPLVRINPPFLMI